MRRTAHALFAIAAIAAGCATAGPPLYIDIDAQYQQLQELPELPLQAGSYLTMRVRLKSDRKWLAGVTNFTARWRGMETMTSTNYLQAMATSSNEAGHYIEIPLTETQTGDARTNWLYRIDVLDGGNPFATGTGTLQIAESNLVPAGSTLESSTWIDATALNATGAIYRAEWQAGDTANSNHVAAATNGCVQVAGDTMTGTLGMGGNTITNVLGLAIGSAAYSTPYPFGIEQDYNGSLRASVKNSSTGIWAQAAVQTENNLGYRASLSVFGSGHATLPNVAGLYSSGYGDMAYVLDGNHNHVWYSDAQDGHSFGALTNEVMSLSPAGVLTVAGGVAGYVQTNHTGDVSIDGALDSGSLAVGDSYASAGSFAAGFDCSTEEVAAVALGSGSTATNVSSMAIGYNCKAYGWGAQAFGTAAVASNDLTFVWSYDYEGDTEYDDHGEGTFNINPDGGASGVYIGEMTLPQVQQNANGNTITNLAAGTASDHAATVGQMVASNTAALTTYSGATSGLAATDVQAAVDEEAASFAIPLASMANNTITLSEEYDTGLAGGIVLSQTIPFAGTGKYTSFPIPVHSTYSSAVFRASIFSPNTTNAFTCTVELTGDDGTRYTKAAELFTTTEADARMNVVFTNSLPVPNECPTMCIMRFASNAEEAWMVHAEGQWIP